MIKRNQLPEQQTKITFSFFTAESSSLERESESFYIIRSYLDYKEQIPQKEWSAMEMELIIKPKIQESKIQDSQDSLDEIFGLWKDRNINLDKIRGQQWERRIK